MKSRYLEPRYTPSVLAKYLADVEANLLKYFWEHVDRSPGHGPWGNCWLWTGCKDENGYGRPNKYGLKTRIHRFSYELYFGPVLVDDLIVRHQCDTPACVNPSHLVLGTRLDNARDRDHRGRNGVMGSKNPHAKLSEAQVIEIRQSWTGQYGQASALMRQYGIKAPALYAILSGTTWKHLDPHHSPVNLLSTLPPLPPAKKPWHQV